jgi:hypothetical protein
MHALVPLLAQKVCFNKSNHWLECTAILHKPQKLLDLFYLWHDISMMYSIMYNLLSPGISFHAFLLLSGALRMLM